MSNRLPTGNSSTSIPKVSKFSPTSFSPIPYPYLKILLLFFFISSCSGDDEQISVPGNNHNVAETLRNISYGEDARQTYDLYLPANRSSTSTKAIILIHGGGWVQGDKRNMESYIPILKESHPEYAIVNLNYRLADFSQPAFPDQFLDLKFAIEKLTKDAGTLGIKPEFGLIGTSAGGHLALQFDSVYDSRNQVKMVCSIVGPTDLSDPFYQENSDFALLLQVLIDREEYDATANLARSVSPAYQVTGRTSPTILFYGEDDNLVPVRNGVLMQERLNAAGVPNNLTIYTGGHGDWENRDNIDLQLQLNNFIDSYLPIEE